MFVLPASLTQLSPIACKTKVKAGRSDFQNSNLKYKWQAGRMTRGTHDLRAGPGAVRDDAKHSNRHTTGGWSSGKGVPTQTHEASCAVGDGLMTHRCGRPHPHTLTHTLTHTLPPNHPEDKPRRPAQSKAALSPTLMDSCCFYLVRF